MKRLSRVTHESTSLLGLKLTNSYHVLDQENKTPIMLHTSEFASKARCLLGASTKTIFTALQSTASVVMSAVLSSRLLRLIYNEMYIKKPSPLVKEMVPIQLMQADPSSFDLLEVVQI